MGFLAPGLLGLTILAGIPLAVHLLTKLTKRQIEFPGLFLLTGKTGGLASFSRWRDWLALLLRVLAVVLLVLAVAGIQRPAATATGGQGDLVLIVDASASMHQQNHASTAWLQARTEAQREIDSVSGRRVLLLHAGDELRRSAREPTTDRGAAMALLATQQPSFGTGSMAQAFASARDVLADAGGDMVIISDLAAGSLDGINLSAVAEDIAVRTIGVGAGRDNIAITGMWIEPGIAQANQACRVGVEVHNYSTTERSITLDLAWDGDRARLSTSVPAGGRSTLSEQITFEQPGQVQLQATALLDDGSFDALTADNYRTGIIHIREAMSATVISDRPVDADREALAPVLAALAAAGIRTNHLPSTALAKPLPTDELLITVGLARVPDNITGLERHVQQAGSWLQIIDSPADIELGQSVQSAPPPITWTSEIDISASGTMPIGRAQLEHRLLTPFFGREVLLAQVEAWRFVGHQDPIAEATRILMQYRDGSIALAERAIGAGRWIVLNMSPAEARSNLAAIDFMPLLFARLSQALVPDREDQLAVACGSWLDAPLGLEDPKGQRATVVDGRVRLAVPGIHVGPSGELVAAAVPATESDLTPLDETMLNAMGAHAGAANDHQQRDRAWWPYVLLIAAACMACEMLLLANHPWSWGRR